MALALYTVGYEGRNVDELLEALLAAGVTRLHNGSYSALVDLAESLDDGTACLLCFERDHAVCHRDVIVDSLRELRPGLAVDHL